MSTTHTATFEVKILVAVDIELGDDGIDPPLFDALDRVRAAVRANTDKLVALVDEIDSPAYAYVGDVTHVETAPIA